MECPQEQQYTEINSTNLKNKESLSEQLIQNPQVPCQSQDASADSEKDVSQRARLDVEKLTDDEADLLYDIVEVTTQLLEKHKVRYMIDGGTLLGAVRNGGLIPHDNDADFVILESDLERTLSLESEFAKYGLVLVKTPGWGLQVSHAESPEIAPGLWTDGVTSWTSRWPFLDLITISLEEGQNGEEGKYMCAQDVARFDYPNYYFTKSAWEEPLDLIQFGHIPVRAMGGQQTREEHLDRNYKDWRTKIEMIMDHRANVYFDTPIVCSITEKDLLYRGRSKKPSILSKPQEEL